MKTMKIPQRNIQFNITTTNNRSLELMHSLNCIKHDIIGLSQVRRLFVIQQNNTSFKRGKRESVRCRLLCENIF